MARQTKFDISAHKDEITQLYASGEYRVLDVLAWLQERHPDMEMSGRTLERNMGRWGLQKPGRKDALTPEERKVVVAFIKEHWYNDDVTAELLTQQFGKSVSKWQVDRIRLQNGLKFRINQAPEDRTEVIERDGENASGDASWKSPASTTESAAYSFHPSLPHSPSHYPPGQTALLLCDFQNLTLMTLTETAATGPDNSDSRQHPALLTAVRLRDWALHRNILTIHCLVDLSPNAAAPPPTSRLAPRWRSLIAKSSSDPSLAEEARPLAARRCAQNSYAEATHHTHPGWHPNTIQTVPNDNEPPELTFLRPLGHVSAFATFDLQTTLTSHNVHSLIIAGISSSGVVLSTARAAVDLGFVVTIVSNACADRNGDVHNVIMKDVLPGTSHVAPAEILMGSLEKDWIRGADDAQGGSGLRARKAVARRGRGWGHAKKWKPRGGSRVSQGDGVVVDPELLD